MGLPYSITEVNPYNKEEITSFTRARQLPILAIEDKETKARWHLANATAILSALESIRNERYEYFDDVLTLYLPILKGKKVHTTINPNKYSVTKSNLK